MFTWMEAQTCCHGHWVETNRTNGIRDSFLYLKCPLLTQSVFYPWVYLLKYIKIWLRSYPSRNEMHKQVFFFLSLLTTIFSLSTGCDRGNPRWKLSRRHCSRWYNFHKYRMWRLEITRVSWAKLYSEYPISLLQLFKFFNNGREIHYHNFIQFFSLTVNPATANPLNASKTTPVPATTTPPPFGT